MLNKLLEKLGLCRKSDLEYYKNKLAYCERKCEELRDELYARGDDAEE